ncbi:MAG TPA: RDD family protein [Vicinamibacterales bacterium]|nr:RDD family protein [Vicinamibacterales bacterium]
MAANGGSSEIAGFWRRLSAYVLDCAVLLALLAAVHAALYGVNPVAGMIADGQQPHRWQLHLWVFATATVPFLLYFTGTTAGARQGTLGMRLLNLRVAKVDGSRLTVLGALGRSGLLLLPFELNHAMMFHLLPNDGIPGAAYVAAWRLSGFSWACMWAPCSCRRAARACMIASQARWSTDGESPRSDYLQQARLSIMTHPTLWSAALWRAARCRRPAGRWETRSRHTGP